MHPDRHPRHPLPPRLRVLLTGLALAAFPAPGEPVADAPPGPRPLLGASADRLPGMGLMQAQPGTTILPFGTTESAGDGEGLLLFTHRIRPGQTSMLVAPGNHVMVTSNRNDFAEYAGLRFWVKGDGSDAEGFLSVGTDLDASVRVPLASREWREVRYPWSRLPYGFNTNRSVTIIGLGIRVPAEDPRYFLLDEISFIRRDEDPGAPFPALTTPEMYRTLRPTDPGYILFDVQKDLDRTQGIRFKIRGGGTTRRARVHWEGASERAVFLTLTSTRWEERKILWKDMPPPERKTQHLVFRFDPDPPPAHWMVIDRLELVRDWKDPPAVKPTAPNFLVEGLSAARFVLNPEAAAGVLQKIGEGRNASVVVLGDALLSVVPPPHFADAGEAFMNSCALAPFPALMARYKPASGHRNFDEYQPTLSSWKSLGRSSPWISALRLSAAVMPDSDGRTLEAGIAHALTLQPDLVILQFGTLHILYSQPEVYQEHLERAIRAFQDKGVIVAVGLPPPVADTVAPAPDQPSPWRRSGEFIAIARETARQAGCAVVDVPGAFLARGPELAGPFYQDRVHLSTAGHQMISQLYLRLLGVENITLWQGLPPTALLPVGEQ